MIRVCIAGATGWAGRALTAGVLAAEDMQLVSAVARSAAGSDLGLALGGSPLGIRVSATVTEALADGVDVMVDYTSHAAVGGNVKAAVNLGVSVVVGSSGLSAADFAEIDALAREHRVGVISAGNFSITAAMAQAAALFVARHLPQVEIIDYADSAKPDAPSGTACEMAERLAGAGAASTPVAPDVDSVNRAARGAEVGSVRVHSLRLPGYSLSTEAVFGLPDERLTIRHDAGTSAEPYVAGTLLAIRRVIGRVGLTRGLDTLLAE
ncbi:MAG: 4-hydroxy-tetrahydrodipicolinate reductase [Candidatus Limnocylindrales bacterium]